MTWAATRCLWIKSVFFHEKCHSATDYFKLKWTNATDEAKSYYFITTSLIPSNMKKNSIGTSSSGLITCQPITSTRNNECIALEWASKSLALGNPTPHIVSLLYSACHNRVPIPIVALVQPQTKGGILFHKELVGLQHLYGRVTRGGDQVIHQKSASSLRLSSTRPGQTELLARPRFKSKKI